MFRQEETLYLDFYGYRVKLLVCFALTEEEWRGESQFKIKNKDLFPKCQPNLYISFPHTEDKTKCKVKGGNKIKSQQ